MSLSKEQKEALKAKHQREGVSEKDWENQQLALVGSSLIRGDKGEVHDYVIDLLSYQELADFAVIEHERAEKLKARLEELNMDSKEDTLSSYSNSPSVSDKDD